MVFGFTKSMSFMNKEMMYLISLKSMMWSLLILGAKMAVFFLVAMVILLLMLWLPFPVRSSLTGSIGY